MTKKYKIIVAVMAAVLVLVIAGLAVGLVLVAQQVQMTNSVSVTYVADNVECDIKAYAIHHIADVENAIDKTIDLDNIDATKMEIVQIKDGDTYVNSVTDEIHAYDVDGAEGNKTNTQKNRIFAQVALRPVAAADKSTTSSVVIYYFEITNKSGFDLHVTSVYETPKNTDNVTIEVGGGNVGDASGVYNEAIVSLDDTTCMYFAVKIDDMTQNVDYDGVFTLNIEKSKMHGGGADN